MAAIDVQTPVSFERMMLATDFSCEAAVALDYAVGLARHFSSHLELTNVIDLSLTFPTLDVLSGPALDSMRHKGAEDIERAADGISGIKLSKTVLEGFEPVSLILDEAVNANSDLIILSTTCQQGIKRFALGSAAEEIIRTAPCPILTVGPHVPPPPPGPISFQRIVYATDFSDRATKAACVALALGRTPGSKVYLCHVVSNREYARNSGCDEAARAHLKALVPECVHDWCSPECVVEHGKAAEAILALARRVNADVIVVGARKPSFWHSFIETGITPALLAGARCPVLTFAGTHA